MSERKFIHRGFSFYLFTSYFPYFPFSFLQSSLVFQFRKRERWGGGEQRKQEAEQRTLMDSDKRLQLVARIYVHLNISTSRLKQNETPWILLLSRSVSSKPPSHLTKTDSKKNLATAAEAENRKASFWLTVTVSFCFGFSFSTWGVSPSGLCSFCRQKLSCDLARSQPKAQGSFTYIRGIQQISCNLSLLAYHQTSLPLLFTPTGNEAQGNTSVNTTPLINGKKKFYPNYKISKHT